MEYNADMSFAKDEECDWGIVSERFDTLKKSISNLDLTKASEAQTRLDVIDRLIFDVLEWQTGQVSVEERAGRKGDGYIDYILRVGDYQIVLEAKKAGATFPLTTKKTRLKLKGSVIGSGDIKSALDQAETYASTKNADIVCVTNGFAWCFYSMSSVDNDSYATILFPFDDDNHAQQIYETLSMPAVHNGSILKIKNTEIVIGNKLINIIHDADGRLNRNSIAEYIVPALNQALYADALIGNTESLERCYVSSEGRYKFDSQLGIHLADLRPSLIKSAPRIQRGRSNGILERIINNDTKDHAPPVTLIIGSVGAGKSTYLKHFELISGSKLLNKKSAHWIYLDFEAMGKNGNPREYMYSLLREYLNGFDDTYAKLVEPAYEDTVNSLVRGPLALLRNNKDELNKRVTDYIQKDYDQIEPYVDKLLGYLVKNSLCILVLDNVDLYESEELETSVFSEGLALSKRINIQVIVSIRDHTYIKHRNSPTFNAYELRRLWLDPPPFKPVLSKRLAYSRKILDRKSAKIPFENGIQLSIPDLGVFFDIVQRSVLQGTAGDYIESMADSSIRRGLDLIGNFLTSGHIQADRALKLYIEGTTDYHFPFHEVFKGTVLGERKFYREDRAECLNLFDSHLGSSRLKLLRLTILSYLVIRAKDESTLNTTLSDCFSIFTQTGASELDVITVMEDMRANNLIKSVTGEEIRLSGGVVITHSGAYYLKKLCRTMVYVEQCMFDTSIEDSEVWSNLQTLTGKIEVSGPTTKERMIARRSRLQVFLNYLETLEKDMLEKVNISDQIGVLKQLTKDVLSEAHDAVEKVSRRTTY